MTTRDPAGTELSAGDQLESAYSAYYPAIRRYVARLVGDSEAEDVAQETFLKAFHSLADVRQGSSLRPWLYRVATNAAIDRLRNPARAKATSLPFDEGRLNEDGNPVATCPQPSVESEAIRGEMGVCVRAIVERLPESQRVALLLSEYEGLRDAEIAAAVGASVASIKIRLHRARAKLKEELGRSCRIYRDSGSQVACEPVIPLSRILRRQ